MELRTLVLGIVALVAGCAAGPAPIEVELIHAPVTLSQAPQYFADAEPLGADTESLFMCVYPAFGYDISDHWTVRAPRSRETQVLARAELTNGRTVRLTSPVSVGGCLCVQPRLGGPLASPVRRVSIVTSTPIVVERIVWRSRLE